VDVSEGGVGFQAAPRELVLGSPIQVALLLPGWHRHTSEFLKYDDTSLSQPLTAVGQVTRCARGEDGTYEVGVKFLDIWADHWNAMRVFLEKERGRLESGDLESAFGFGTESCRRGASPSGRPGEPCGRG
jgi:hypothetical protein